MTDVVAARDAYVGARAEVTRTRLELGRVIRDARRAGVEQGEIARTLKLTREQIRRYQFEYEKWLRGQTPDAAVAC
jgi:hypothetical protein